MEEKLTRELEEQLSAAKSLEDMVKICTDAGIPITKEQLKAAALPDTHEELTEEELDAVSGGSMYYAFRQLLERLSSRNRNHSGGGHRF